MNIRNWAQWATEPIDAQLLAEVLEIFKPVHNLGHKEGLPENNWCVQAVDCVYHDLMSRT